MRKLLYIVMSTAVIVALFGISKVSALSSTYFISPTGSDANSGASASSPWLTPNHALNCGDTIQAAAGTYSANNFGNGKWGTVTCPSQNNVAWLTCSTFDGCKINSTGNDGIRVSSSYWGVSGWEITNSVGSCFVASPSTSSTTIHHIIFANNIANGCKNNGFNSYPYSGSVGPASVDYLVVVGNLAYNAAGGNSECFSGISIYEPRNFDALAGTHIYIGQNISWSNVDGATCPGNSDGEGIIFDDWLGDQSGFTTPYTGQGVAENNLLIGNGGPGVEAFHSINAPIYIKNNTTYGNLTDIHHAGSYQGEVLINHSSMVSENYNIFDAITATAGANGYAYYAEYTGLGDGTNSIDYNWAVGVSGHNTSINSSPGFSYGAHQILGSNPLFASSSIPGAPNCNGAANTLNCMATTLAGFSPSATGISGYGVQPFTTTYSTNAYYPSWLCNVAMPAGIVSNYCNAPTPTPTYTTTNTFTPTSTNTATATITPTFTETSTLTSTPTNTSTSTFTIVPTQTFTSTNTTTFTPTITVTNTETFTPTLTSTPTFTNTPTNTFTPTFTTTPTNTITPTFTSTVTRTPECIIVTFIDDSKIIVCKP